MSDSSSFLGKDDYLLESVYDNGRPPVLDSSGPVLTANLSFKSDGKNKKKQPSVDGDDILNLLHNFDPVKVEFNRLENKYRPKNQSCKKVDENRESMDA
ncbi:hypothetical protein SUGI_0008660 [Cryptomeria japonica]|nr:hypothetical protein SUGI_0008660 [Cryptomeria japonica]